MKNTINELEALKNAVNSTNIQGLAVVNWYQEDKRKSKPIYLLSINGACISPKLAYNEMNHFLWGIINYKKHLNYKRN